MDQAFCGLMQELEEGKWMFSIKKKKKKKKSPSLLVTHISEQVLRNWRHHFDFKYLLYFPQVSAPYF